MGWDGEGSAMSLCFVESLLAERKKEKIVKVKFVLKIKYTYRNLLSAAREKVMLSKYGRICWYLNLLWFVNCMRCFRNGPCASRLGPLGAVG